MDIIVSDLTKSYGSQKVLDGFSAVFPHGTVTCVMGPSGGGKTTLLNILMGLCQPDGGSVAGVPEKKSAVFQEDRLCEDFSALTNVRMVLDKSFSRETITSHMDEIGLGGEYSKPVREFSGGMKRRAALVRAVLADSEVLFLDEPLKGLDDQTKDSVIGYLKKHFNGRTVIMVTHDRNEAVSFGARLVTLE